MECAKNLLILLVDWGLQTRDSPGYKDTLLISVYRQNGKCPKTPKLLIYPKYIFQVYSNTILNCPYIIHRYASYPEGLKSILVSSIVR